MAAGIVTRFAYDARHRVIAIDHPIGGDEGFAYNGEGELTAHTDRAGQRIEIGRDGLGRITERRYGAAQSGEVSREAFTLDGDGQPTTLSQYGAADGPQHVQRRYDGQGRLIEEDDRFNQRSTWTYDEAGNRLSVTDPAGTTTTAPDRLNRIARQTTAAGSTELSYSTAGRLRQITHPNGARSETRYDAAGRIERITHHQGSSEVARFEYTYDARGNRREERRIDASGTQRTTYDYDKDDRLTGTTVTAPGGSVTETTYTLDPVGNRRQEVVRRNGATVSDIAYTYQAYQRLTETRDSVSGVLTEYAYDARGHLISETTNGQTTTYRPNAQDRLATLTLPGAPPVQIDYAYDSEGKRVERRTPTELTRFGWDGQTLRRETNAANNVIEAHDWAAGRILSSRRLNDTRYAQHDALRSPIRWSQSTGAEQGQLRYDAWGETTDTHPDLPRIAYTGHYREREGSSYYAQQRYYRPGLGRFNRVDPWEGDAARPITLNKYLYALGNPLLYTDPDGRCPMALSPSECFALQAEMLGVDPYTREGAKAVVEFETGRTVGQLRGAWSAVKESAQFLADVPGSMIDLIPGVDVGSLDRMGERASGAWQLAKSPIQTVTTAGQAQLTAYAEALEAGNYRGAGEVQGGFEGNVFAGSAMTYTGAGLTNMARGTWLGRLADQQARPLTVVENPNESIASNLGETLVTWVDEGGDLRNGGRPGMRPDAYEYQSSASGARSGVDSGRSQAPYLEYQDDSGRVVGAKFDGVSGTELIDRKLNPVFSAKAVDQARRQVAVAQHHGLQAVWELPSQRAVDAANRFMTANKIEGIVVRLKEP